MSRQLFTDDGVQNKTQELYSLPDVTLRAETESLRVDFKSWMHFHFDLNQEQSTFLESMEYPASQILAEDLADCLLFRLLLSVVFEPKKPTGSKLVKPASELVRVYEPMYQVSGQLRIDIVYE